MSGTTEIRAALIGRLVAASPGAGISSSSVAWENKDFNPASARWYRVAFLPGEPRAAAIGTDAQNRHVGIFQIDIMSPTGAGDVPAQTEAERIAACYKRGTVLTSSGVSVIIDKAYRMPGDSSDPAWYRIPVRVQWRADVDN